MKKYIFALIFVLFSQNAVATSITSGVIVTPGGEVKPHSALKLNFAIDPNFTYTTTCFIDSPKFKDNVILGSFESSNYGFIYHECLFNGKPMKNGLFLLDQPENKVTIPPDSSTYPVKEIIFHNSDNDDSFTIRNCVSTLIFK